LPCPGLTVTFIREITDVTDAVLHGITDTTDENFRSVEVKFRSDSIEKSIAKNLKGIVRPFYNGNKFYLFTTEVYSDIRFVGAPPQSIGKFGGETDNWVWPRHTGDFSLFRIYSDKENKPAQYSASNIPYTPKKFLKINIGGVKENDFVFVFGFPGRTNEYLISDGLETIVDQTNPNRIAIRDIRLDEMRNAMRQSDTIRLQYAAKFSTIENSYKKWKGELLGFEHFDVVNRKESNERTLFHDADTTIFTEYKTINAQARPLNFAIDFYSEAFSAIELLNATARFNKLIEVFNDTSKTQKDHDAEVMKCKNDFRNFYKNYNRSLDKRISGRLLNFVYEKVDKDFLPQIILDEGKKEKGDFKNFNEKLFKESFVGDSVRLMKFLSSFTRKDIKKIKNDIAYRLMDDIAGQQQVVQMQLVALNQQMNRIQRRYVARLMMEEKSKIYPDANSTLRVAYGRVEGMIPNDGMQYRYYTTADGILAKSKMDVYDYKIPDRLKKLISDKDYGRFGKNGQLNVAFLASAHTTGGNSGSPVLNARGELVGINFDRMWEGVLSDYYYDEMYCRNICLDVRYLLFIIDKYGNANRLIDEMQIVD
jgi:hypothetical protein